MSEAMTASLSDTDRRAKAEALALWERDRARLMLAQPFLALLAMQLELVPVVDARLDTAATDGERVFGDAHFLLGLSAGERVFVLAHEVWHCAALHFVRRGDRDAKRWNLAADHEVNALLREQGLRVPGDAVLYEGQCGQNAETVYLWLQNNPRESRARAPWADLHGPVAAQTAHPGLTDPDYQPGTGSWQSWPSRVVSAAQQVQRQQGRLPAGVQQLVDDYRNPRLPWTTLLRRFVTRGLERRRRWMPPNRRYLSQGLYLPGQERVPRLEVALAIDTSGSTIPELPDFLSELLGIIKAFGDYRLRVLMCDAAVHSDETYTPLNPPVPGRVSFSGGGGTDFRPVFRRLQGSESPRVLVWLTDGMGRAPDESPPYPVLWALTHDGERPASWGEVVRLPPAGEEDACHQ